MFHAEEGLIHRCRPPFHMTCEAGGDARTALSCCAGLDKRLEEPGILGSGAVHAPETGGVSTEEPDRYELCCRRVSILHADLDLAQRDRVIDDRDLPHGKRHACFEESFLELRQPVLSTWRFSVRKNASRRGLHLSP